MCMIGASLALTLEEERTFSVPQSKTWALTGSSCEALVPLGQSTLCLAPAWPLAFWHPQRIRMLTADAVLFLAQGSTAMGTAVLLTTVTNTEPLFFSFNKEAFLPGGFPVL